MGQQKNRFHSGSVVCFLQRALVVWSLFAFCSLSAQVENASRSLAAKGYRPSQNEVKDSSRSLVTTEQIRPTMEEIFTYHVESHALTPELVQRAIKNYVLQFDPEKRYLLRNEVEPFLQLSESSLQEVIQQYQHNQVDLFVALNQVVQSSIERARQIRIELLREEALSLHEQPEALGVTYLRYAATQDELRERVRADLRRYLQRAKTTSLPSSHEPIAMDKLLSFYDHRLERHERSYGAEKQEREESWLAVHVLKAMAKSLDSHTAYFTPSEAFEIRMNLEKEFEGVGIVLKEDVNGVVIADVLKGSPAEKCRKIAKGDQLLKIDQADVSLLAYEEVLERLKGNEEKKVVLEVRHGDGQKESISLKRERISVEEERVSYAAAPFGEGVIGLVNLPSFYESASGISAEKDLLEAIRSLKREGKLMGLVLDLRENSGGFLSQAVKVAGLFISSGVVVISKYAKGEVRYLRDIDGKIFYDGPLLVLTSKASASAAEIVAQALQDYGIALVAGDNRTFGKGSIQYQTLTDPQAKAFFKVTVGRYYTVSGRSTQIEGVRADIEIPTRYNRYQIGERFLDYPLSMDRVPSAYVDPLTDLQENNRSWFQKFYLPNVQKKVTRWREMLKELKENSRIRIVSDPNFSLFMRYLEEGDREDWGVEDLQLKEACEIVKDMILLSQPTQKPAGSQKRSSRR